MQTRNLKKLYFDNDQKYILLLCSGRLNEPGTGPSEIR